MDIHEIFLIDENIENPKPVDSIEFLTSRLCAIYIGGELGFTFFNWLHFYMTSKEYVDRQTILSSKSFNFNSKPITVQEVEELNSEYLQELIDTHS